MKTKRIALCSMLTALAIVLSLVEKMFPLDAVLPVPGIKLGLANIVTLFALVRLCARDALVILVLRVSLASLLFGGLTGFLFSISGGLLAWLVMWSLLRFEGKSLSYLGISVAGAAMHNVGQISVAVFWMCTGAVVAYLPLLLVMSIPLGLVTGLTASVFLTHLKKISLDA